MEHDDRVAIQNVLNWHCIYIDEVDPVRWADLFTEDGSFSFDPSSLSIPMPPAVGREALLNFGRTSFPIAAGVHFAGNAIIDIEGDEANVLSYAIAFQGRPQPHIGTAARFRDHFRKVDGKWLIASRVVSLRIMNG
jgi:SnoaL-like domain